jgi:hypothetical protein
MKYEEIMKYIMIMIILFFYGCQFGGPDPNMDKGECSEDFPMGVCAPGKICKAGQCYKEDPDCSIGFPNGKCYDDKICFKGECVIDANECSIDHPDGICNEDKTCVNGVCEKEVFICSSEHLDGICDNNQICVNGNCVSESNKCSINNPTGVCDSNFTCIDGECIADGIDLGTFNTFTGVWAQKQFLPSDNKFSGITTATKTNNYYILTMTQNSDNTITSIAKLCDIQVEVENPMGGTEFSDKYINSMRNSTTSYQFFLQNGKIIVKHQEHIEVNGANMENLTDDLPISPDDTRVIDQDNDGNPGMTLNILVMGSKVGLYVVDRSKKTLNGEIIDDDSFGGSIIWSEEQSVIGADNEAFHKPLEITPSEGTFKNVRIDNTWDCERLKNEEDTLFE